MSLKVIDNTVAGRYELFVDDELAGLATYELDGVRLSILHVEVQQHRAGHGLGKSFVDEVLGDARRRGLAVLPRCPFTRRIIAENQDDYLDLVPADVREEFKLPL